MNNELIDRLTQLDLEEKSLRRNLDKYYCDEKMRTRIFARLKKIKLEIEKTKFKLHLEREIKNEDNNTY